MVASFTKAAAQELAGRKTFLDRHQIGTLHAHCFRAIGRGEIAETKIEEWNKEHRVYAMSRDGMDIDDPSSCDFGGSPGDEHYARMQGLRARMVPMELWPPRVSAFNAKWTEWKRSNCLIDFTDMLEMAYHDFEKAPGNPAVGFFDEAQDFTRLELSLVRKWGESMEWFIVAGDDDQSIFSFKGATPDAFLEPRLGPESRRVLSQSYRVPRAVHKFANEWIHKLTAREPKDYLPRDADGEVRHARSIIWKEPNEIVKSIEADLSGGKSVMVLGACSYIIAPTVKLLRSEGIPFHNPYRRRRGDWNPLRRSGKGKSTAERLLSFLRVEPETFGDEARMWSEQELFEWAGMLSVAESGLKRGVKDSILRPTNGVGGLVSVSRLLELFNEDAVDKMLFTAGQRERIEWMQKATMRNRRAKVEYPAKILGRMGRRGLEARPQVVVGTIHSVKGGEADVVYLFPDISGSAMMEWTAGGIRKDSVLRQFYVGFTRARERLVLCGSASQTAVF